MRSSKEAQENSFGWSRGAPLLGLVAGWTQVQQPVKWFPWLIIGYAFGVNVELSEDDLVELPANASVVLGYSSCRSPSISMAAMRRAAPAWSRG
jgi:hypothetical protein